MRVCCPALSPIFHPQSYQTARIPRKHRDILILAILLVLAAAPQAMGGPIPPLPSFLQDTLPTIGANSLAVYCFHQGPGPLAHDFDDTNLDYAAHTHTTPMTTAQYFFNGTVLPNSNHNGDPVGNATPAGIPVFAVSSPGSQGWSPASNLTGGFVPFLGFDANGNEVDARVKPTRVADIVDASGHQYGYILADYDYHSRDNTTFAFVNTSSHAIDPTITGEQVGISIPEQFIGAPQITNQSPGISTPGASSNGGGFTVSNITATTPTTGQADTETITASQSFIAVNSSAQSTLTMSKGTITVGANGGETSSSGGSGSLVAQSIIADATGKTVQTLTLPTINFSATASQLVYTQPFSSSTASGGLALIAGATYSVSLTWTLNFTPGDQFSYAKVDPDLIFNEQPFASAPAPPSLVLAVIGVVCLGGFQLVLRRTRMRHTCPLAA